MRIHGFQKMTLLDFPGRVACTVFTGGCNLRCPFCHNSSLVTEIDGNGEIDRASILHFLSKRKGVLDGVAITGGEPLLQSEIGEFISDVKELGFAVKLDTNGCFPEKLKSLLRDGLVDYVAMDIKNSMDKYAHTVGLAEFDHSKITESVAAIMSQAPDYEFRTTVVKEFHEVADIEAIARQLSGAKRYFLQNFVDSGNLIGHDLHAHEKSVLEEMKSVASNFIKNVEIRGI